MSDDETGLNPEERAQIAGNRRLAGRFIREWIESPERVEPFPYGTAVVLMPPDDPVLAAANPALTEQLGSEGRTVRLHRLEVSPTDHPAGDANALRIISPCVSGSSSRES